MSSRSKTYLAMLRKLAESGLNAKDAERLHFVAMETEELRKKFPHLTNLPAPGFTIPYYDFNGKVTPFFRYRYLEQPQRKGFDAITVHKPVRYIQPSGMSPRVYFSPLCDWRDLYTREAAERPIIITEGENKANCAVKNGLPCIGLGGVWNFKSKTEALIKDLNELEWEDVPVYITYDSDSRSNFQVMMAENALAKELLAKGAIIYIVRLPVLEEGKKTGLDDYLVANGVEEFYKLMERTEPWEQSRMLHELNEEVVFVHDPGSILEIKTLQRMSVQTFTHGIYANRVMVETVAVGKTGTKTVKKSAAKEWITWPFRAEVARTTYAPGQPRITSKREFNTWPGWGMNGDTVRPGPTKLWDELLDYLTQDEEPSIRIWLEQWLAYPIQHPGTKMYCAAVAWGLKQGTGKTLVGHVMKRLYGSNFAEIADTELNGTFNDWAENKQFVMGDEISGGDKRAIGDRMKGMITRPTIRINPKFIPAYEVPDVINYYFTSNHPDSLFLEDNDRRYCVIEIKSHPLPRSFYKEFDSWYRSDAAGHIMYKMQTLSLTGYDPKEKAPMTRAKRDMQEMGRSEVGAWVADLRETPDNVLKAGDNGAPQPFSLMTTDELYAIFTKGQSSKVTRPGLGRELRRGGFEKVNHGDLVWTSTKGPQRLWAVRRAAELLRMNTKQLAAIYDAEHGGRKKEDKF